MILERVEIVGFRGINRPSLMLEQNNNVLIGKRSQIRCLLDALTCYCRRNSISPFVREDLVSARRHKATRVPPAYYSDSFRERS